MAESPPLQQRLESCLSAVGYGDKVGHLPPEVTGNERLAAFMEWVVREAVQPSNYLSSSELERYAELKSSGNILEGHELARALTSTEEEEEESCETIRRGISTLQKIKAPLQAQLQTMSSTHQKLSDHHTTLLRRRDELSRRQSELKRNYQQALETAHQDNTKVNEALEGLKAAVEEMSAFHRGDKETAIPFISVLSQDSYHLAEDRFLAELTAYTKKQFFKGIAMMAHCPVSSEYSTVDLGDTEEALLRGVSKEEFQKHHRELKRLQSLYPLAEVQRVNDLVAEQHALGACRKAQQELKALEEEQRLQLDHETLRQCLSSKQAEVAELRMQIHTLGQTELPGLLRDTSVLQVTRVLHGDYDLKLARQDYFISKQDKVIGHLLAQRARSELLSMLYEVELRRHRETHRLLTAAQAQLTQWREGRERRTEAMQSAAIRPAKAVRQTVDSRDQFAQRLCTLLGVQPSSSHLITHASLVSAVQQLAHRVATLEGLAESSDAEQLRLVKDIETLASKLEVQVYGCSGPGMAKPRLTTEEFKEECSKLRAVLTTLEQSIKALLKDYDSKKKVLQANPLVERERRLFVYFFTDPPKLSRALGELASRVDAALQAHSLQTQ